MFMSLTKWENMTGCEQSEYLKVRNLEFKSYSEYGHNGKPRYIEFSKI